MPHLRHKLLAVPATYRAIGRFLWLIGQSNDPYRLIYYAKEGDVERAFETLDMSDEEIHATISAIRNDAETVVEEVVYGQNSGEDSESFVETARRIRDEERDVLDALDDE